MSASWSRSALGLVIAALFVFSTFAGVLAQTPVAETSLRVMTYNTAHSSGNDDCTDPEKIEGHIPETDCALNLERVAEVIRSQGVDVVGLQEVDRFWARSGGVDQAAELGSLLDMDVCYGANLDHEANDHADVPHQ